MLIDQIYLLAKNFNIAHGESQFPVCFTSEPNLEAFAVPKDYLLERNHLNEEN